LRVLLPNSDRQGLSFSKHLVLTNTTVHARLPFDENLRFQLTAHTQSELALEPLEASVVKRMFELCLKGLGLLEIAKTLNQEGVRTRGGNSWNKTVIHYMLKNETYAGILLFNKNNKKEAGRNVEECIRVELRMQPSCHLTIFTMSNLCCKSAVPK
jgi:hypothetical protein